MMSNGAMPLSRSGTPKVKRLTPEIGSVPTVETIMPTIAAARPFSKDLLASEAITVPISRMLRAASEESRLRTTIQSGSCWLIERRASEDITMYFRAISQMLTIIERMLVLSPQELGQAEIGRAHV